MGTALCFGLFSFGWSFFNLLPLRIWGVMTNQTLLAVPLFVFMGVMLERSGLAEELLDTMACCSAASEADWPFRCGGGCLAGRLDRYVGATVVTMGLLAVPTMLKRGYNKALATGTVSASGTLGQIIPPSIVLVLIGDIVGVPVGDLFMGAVLPGLVLVGLYIFYILVICLIKPKWAPPIPREELAALTPRILFARVMRALFPPLFLMVAVLGSIFCRHSVTHRGGCRGGRGSHHSDRDEPQVQHGNFAPGDAHHPAADLHGFHYPGGVRPPLGWYFAAWAVTVWCATFLGPSPIPTASGLCFLS